VQIVVSIAALDLFFGYLAHRAMHAIPLLWRAHRVHHADAFVDATTSFRTHPVEVVWRFLFMMIPIAALGTPAPAVALYRLISGLNVILEHTNITVWPRLDGALAWI